MRHEACADWPQVLCPSPGCFPPAAPLRTNERVLHLANSNHEATASLGLDLIASEYRRVFWPGIERDDLVDVTCAAASAIRPTLVFINIQSDGILCPQDIDAIRVCCDPSVVIIDFDGDQHFEPESTQREWFVELGQACDSSLVVNTEHPAVYARLGVRHPGFFEAAAASSVYHPSTPKDGVPSIVMLAGAGHKVHTERTALIRRVADAYGPCRFAVYGNGWGDLSSARPPLAPNEEAPVYSAADASLSISARHDLPRYTSNRLFFMLASGAISVVESFPDCEGLGLVDGVNCLLWSGWDNLRERLTMALCMSDDVRSAMRTAAAELGQEHTYQARVLELLAIVDAVRASR